MIWFIAEPPWTVHGILALHFHVEVAGTSTRVETGVHGYRPARGLPHRVPTIDGVTRHGRKNTAGRRSSTVDTSGFHARSLLFQ